MNIHLPAILMFTRGIGFWPIPKWIQDIQVVLFSVPRPSFRERSGIPAGVFQWILPARPLHGNDRKALICRWWSSGHGPAAKIPRYSREWLGDEAIGSIGSWGQQWWIQKVWRFDHVWSWSFTIQIVADHQGHLTKAGREGGSRCRHDAVGVVLSWGVYPVSTGPSLKYPRHLHGSAITECRQFKPWSDPRANLPLHLFACQLSHCSIYPINPSTIQWVERTSGSCVDWLTQATRFCILPPVQELSELSPPIWPWNSNIAPVELFLLLMIMMSSRCW